MLEKLKYSISLASRSNTVIIDGEVAKSRFEDSKDATDKYILNAKDNFKDIIVQSGRRIDIYSSADSLEDYLKIIKNIPMTRIMDNIAMKFSNIAVLYQENGAIKVQMYL